MLKVGLSFLKDLLWIRKFGILVAIFTKILKTTQLQTTTQRKLDFEVSVERSYSYDRELPAWPNGYSARQLKLLADPLALGMVRIQEASKNRQQFFFRV